jgi:hypothetical protein
MLGHGYRITARPIPDFHAQRPGRTDINVVQPAAGTANYPQAEALFHYLAADPGAIIYD